jgi:cyclopropane fatty-acyl-phospholipid synthase-like methyltransferase
MKNPVVVLGHTVLQNRSIYNFYQSLVGGVAYRSRFMDSVYNENINTLLDLGCGTGAIMRLISAKTRYIGIDSSPEYLRSASQRGMVCQLITADVASESWKNKVEISGTSLATALGLFHHLNEEQLHALLSHCADLLPPSGQLVSVDPVIVQSTTRIAKWFAKNDRGVYLRDPKHLEEILMRYGFRTSVQIKKREFRIPLDTIEIISTRKS